MDIDGDRSSARNSSAEKICSTPKLQLVDTCQADSKKVESAQKK